MNKCPCDTCKYKDDNGLLEKCPNFNYYFDAMMKAYQGIIKTHSCKDYEPKESKGVI